MLTLAGRVAEVSAAGVSAARLETVLCGFRVATSETVWIGSSFMRGRHLEWT